MASRKDRDEEEKPKTPAVDRSAPEQDEDGSVEVKLEAAEEEDEDDAGDDEPAPQERGPSNKQRRAQNFRETREKAQRLEQENATLRQQQEQYNAWLQHQQMQQRQQQESQQANEEWQKLFQEQEQAYLAFKAIENTATDEQINRYKTQLQDIDRRKMQAILKANGGGGQQLTPQHVRAMHEQQTLMNRYGDVLQHQQAGGWAYGTWFARVRAGEQDSEALRDEIAEEARRRFGMQSQVRRPAPTQAQRARMSGISVGGRESAGGHEGRTMQLSKDDQKMARAMFPKRKDAEAFRLYAANLQKQRAKRAAQKTG